MPEWELRFVMSIKDGEGVGDANVEGTEISQFYGIFSCLSYAIRKILRRSLRKCPKKLC
jgi:hypothetical protein